MSDSGRLGEFVVRKAKGVAGLVGPARPAVRAGAGTG